MHRVLGRDYSTVKSLSKIAINRNYLITDADISLLQLSKCNQGFRDFLTPFNIDFEG